MPSHSRIDQRLGFSSCQSYGHGYFRAHADAAPQDLDLYVFLGDYIYEVRRVASDTRAADGPCQLGGPALVPPEVPLYRSDEALRELHRVQPAVHIWDDHEVANNYSDDHPAPSAAAACRRLQGRVRMAAEDGLPDASATGSSSRSRWEGRSTFSCSTSASTGRSRRQRQARADPRRSADAVAGRRADEHRRRLGRSSRNQVQIAPSDFNGGVSMDSWGGYDAVARAAARARSSSAGIPNVVFVSGDSHVFMVEPARGRLRDVPERPSSTSRPASSTSAGSVTTPGRDSAARRGAGQRTPGTSSTTATSHGYALVGASGSQLVTEYRRSDVFDPDGGNRPVRALRAARGRLEQAVAPEPRRVGPRSAAPSPRRKAFVGVASNP